MFNKDPLFFTRQSLYVSNKSETGVRYACTGLIMWSAFYMHVGCEIFAFYKLEIFIVADTTVAK